MIEIPATLTVCTKKVFKPYQFFSDTKVASQMSQAVKVKSSISKFEPCNFLKTLVTNL